MTHFTICMYKHRQVDALVDSSNANTDKTIIVITVICILLYTNCNTYQNLNIAYPYHVSSYDLGNNEVLIKT